MNKLSNQQSQTESDIIKNLPELSQHQRELYDSLNKLDIKLANYYIGALIVLKQQNNPERFAQSANSIRELIDGFLKHTIGFIQTPYRDVVNKVRNCRDEWNNCLEKTQCYSNNKWEGNIDKHLKKFLKKTHRFFDWFTKHFPRIKKELETAFSKQDPSVYKLPEHIQEKNIDKWEEIRGFFINTLHHIIEPSEEQFDEKIRYLGKMLLDFLKPKTISDINEIDKIIQEGEVMIEQELVEKAISLIRKRYVNYEYFFNNLKSPAWINPLSEKGMFKNPPSNVVSRDGKYIQFLVWPESQYLVRIASKAPELVFKIVLEMPDTENVRVQDDIVDIAVAIPVELSIKLLPKIKNWIKSPYNWLLIAKSGKLIVHLAKGGKIKEAIELADILIDILPDPQWEEKSKSESSVLSFRPHAWFDDWIYEQLLIKDIPILVEYSKLEALKLLCEKLAKAVKFSMHKSEINDPDDNSYIWRPSIESDHDLSRGVRDLLVTAIRNACESLIELEGKEVLNIVESYHYYIFKRIGLYLRRKYFNIDPEGTNKLVVDSNVFDNIALQYEYFHLLKERFNEFLPETKDEYLSLVEKGEKHKWWISARKKADGKEPNQIEIDKHNRYWQYKKLIPIQEYLKNNWRKRFDELKSEFGEIEQPDRHFTTEAWHSGPTSPKSQQELAAMSNDELIVFLKSWQPKDDWDEPEPEGLSRELTNLIKSDPARYAVIADKFIGLDPTYIDGIIQGFNEACRAKMSFGWDKILALCNWVVSQPRKIPNRKKYKYLLTDPDWGWSRKTIASLLSTAFNANAISFEYKNLVWTILKPLTDDPDPEPNKETTLEPYTLAINTVRGEAMNATIEYALWVIRNTKKTSDTQKNIYSFKDMPEVQNVLDKHLDINQEQSLAVRSVYGRWFPWLVLLDQEWTKENKDKIFPKESDKIDFYNAAWNTYIIFCPAYDNVFDILKDEYKFAIERIGKIQKTPQMLRDIDERLAEHLAVLYWRGKLNLKESNGLLELFYKKAPEKLLARTIWYIGNVLYNEKETIPSVIIERLKAFWEWRNQDTTRPISDAERKEFGLWFASGKFDDEWSIRQLKEVLNNVGDVDSSHMVSEYILKITNKMPFDVIECLNIVVKKSKDNFEFYGWKENAREIISAVLKSDNEDAKKLAIETIHILGARGYLEYRDLLPEQNRSET